MADSLAKLWISVLVVVFKLANVLFFVLNYKDSINTFIDQLKTYVFHFVLKENIYFTIFAP